MVGDGRREVIIVAFATATTITPLSMVFGCGAIVDTLPYGSILLEESLAFMMNVEDSWEMHLRMPSYAIPRILSLPGTIPPSYSGGVRILSALGSTTSFIHDAPSVLAHSILWCP